MIIFWFTLLIGVSIFFISYMKIRERIPTTKRNKFEILLMFLLLSLLIIDVGLVIFERRNEAMEMNDCIRFYRYFPNFYNDSEFYFINEWCYNYFDEATIQKLRVSGRKYKLHIESGGIDISEFSDLLKGGNITIENG